RDGHAPDALAADAPVGAGGDHVGDAFFAPGGIPDDLVYFLDGELTESCFGSVGALHRSFKRDEPLLCGAEDDWVVAAPAVRVRVLEIADGEQSPVLFEHGHNDGIGLPDGLVFEGRGRGKLPGLRVRMQTPCGIDTTGLVERILLASVEVVGAVGGSGVDCTGALVGSDVCAENAEDAPLEEGVLVGGVLELAAFEAGEFGGVAESAGGDDGGGEFGGDDVDG